VASDLLTDTQRLSKLVDDLLLLARSDAARVPEQLAEPVELVGLVRDVAARYGDTVEVPESPADCPVWTVGDPDELRRILANLLDNAVRHSRTGVTAQAAKDGRRALLTVTDDGPGIPPADRNRAFERFTRLDGSRTLDTGGSGLGLAIVRELVRRHDGTVTLRDAASSREFPGLRVEVRLPLHEETSG
jgi:signal transduction histidine kinase